MSSESKQVVVRRGSFIQAFRAVAWSFFGVRHSADLTQDAQALSPVHVIIAGIAGAALFVAALVLLVSWVVGSGIAGA